MFQTGYSVRLKTDHSKIFKIEFFGEDNTVSFVGVPHMYKLCDYEPCLVNGLGLDDFAYCWKTRQVIRIIGFLQTPGENVRVTSNSRVFEVYGWSLLTLDESLPELRSKAEEANKLVERIRSFQCGKLESPL